MPIVTEPPSKLAFFSPAAYIPHQNREPLVKSCNELRGFNEMISSYQILIDFKKNCKDNDSLQDSCDNLS